jgi:hypothetical protein
MYMIAMPLNPWDKPKEEITLILGASSIGKSPVDAWYKHTRGDLSKVQAWFDKGYRLKKINVELINE